MEYEKGELGVVSGIEAEVICWLHKVYSFTEPLVSDNIQSSLYFMKNRLVCYSHCFVKAFFENKTNVVALCSSLVFIKDWLKCRDHLLKRFLVDKS